MTSVDHARNSGFRLIPSSKPKRMSKDAISGFGSHGDVNGTGSQTGDVGQSVVSLAEVSATRSAFGSMSLSLEESLFNTAEEVRKVAGFKDWRDAWFQMEVRKQRRKEILKSRHASSGEKRVKLLYEKGQNCSRYGCLICKGPHWTKDCPIEIDLSDDEEDETSPQEHIHKEKGCSTLSGEKELKPDGGLHDVSHVVGLVDLPPRGSVEDQDGEPEVLCLIDHEDVRSPQDIHMEEGCAALSGQEEPRPDGGLNDDLRVDGFVDLPPRSVVDSPVGPEDLCRDKGITNSSGGECHGPTFQNYARRCHNEL